ncbi:DUF3784 domain-containing protein [Haloarcula montana]|uniref:DUF3784 domain-containing protein n=1 Tax=Haloarcula montana TaxID=3111776 RepID=UPI002D76A009|nr:DUF3784 domain-containing protein [Haloarcula sp. GH36]
MELTADAFEWFVVGTLLATVGVLIKFREWTFLLAGYDGTSPVPDDVVQDVAGNTIIRIGVAVFVVGILQSVTNPPSYLGFLIGVGIVLAVLRLVYRLNTYSPTAS